MARLDAPILVQMCSVWFRAVFGEAARVAGAVQALAQLDREPAQRAQRR